MAPPRWSFGEIQNNRDTEFKLDDANNSDEAGGPTAAPNLALKPSKDADSRLPTLQSSGRFGVLRTMENFEIIFGFLFERRPAWRCFDFATVFPNRELISRSASDKHPPLPADSASLSLSHYNSSTPQLDSKS